MKLKNHKEVCAKVAKEEDLVLGQLDLQKLKLESIHLSA